MSQSRAADKWVFHLASSLHAKEKCEQNNKYIFCIKKIYICLYIYKTYNIHIYIYHRHLILEVKSFLTISFTPPEESLLQDHGWPRAALGVEMSHQEIEENPFLWGFKQPGWLINSSQSLKKLTWPTWALTLTMFDNAFKNSMCWTTWKSQQITTNLTSFCCLPMK